MSRYTIHVDGESQGGSFSSESEAETVAARLRVSPHQDIEVRPKGAIAVPQVTARNGVTPAELRREFQQELARRDEQYSTAFDEMREKAFAEVAEAKAAADELAKKLAAAEDENAKLRAAAAAAATPPTKEPSAPAADSTAAKRK